MNLVVGDYVEIIGSPKTSPDAQHLIGLRGTVIKVRVARPEWHYPGEQVVDLVPSEVDPYGRGWYARSVRKIIPPDWEATPVDRRELVE